MKQHMHPGEFLLEAFMKPLELTVRGMAEKVGASATTISNLVNKKSNVTPELAIKLSAALGGSAQRWMNLQASWSLEQALDGLPSVSDEEADKLIDEAYKKMESGNSNFITDSEANAKVKKHLESLMSKQ